MEKFDHLAIRCPRLGGEVRFSYCRMEGGDLPCPRIITCWNSFFPVEEYLRKNMAADAWNNFICQVPKDKITTLIDLIEKAQKRAKLKMDQ